MRVSALVAAVALVLTSCSSSDGDATTTTVESTTTASQPTTTSSSIETTTTLSAPVTTKQPVAGGDIAWTEPEAERMVEGFLAALADGQWAIAAFSMENNGVLPEGSQGLETPTEFLERSCSPDLCLGPYRVTADGPGLVNPASFQASSTVTVTHIPSGETGSMRIATFEGQPVIRDLPPLVPGEAQPLIETLFEGDFPDNVVIGRFDAIERWVDGTQSWSIQWLVEQFFAVDGEVALVYEAGLDQFSITPIDATERHATGRCPYLLGIGVVAFAECPPDVFGPSGEVVPASPFEPAAGGDGQFAFYAERGGTVLRGTGDAEGNLIDLTAGPVDLLGDDYASLPRLSPDGNKIAYVDHADARAASHFWSPVVVIKDTGTGEELNRIAFDAPVLWLEFDGRWVIAGGRSPNDDVGVAPHETIGTHNLETGNGVTLESSVRLWLP